MVVVDGDAMAEAAFAVVLVAGVDGIGGACGSSLAADDRGGGGGDTAEAAVALPLASLPAPFSASLSASLPASLSVSSSLA